MSIQRLKKIFWFIVRVWILARHLLEILSYFETKQSYSEKYPLMNKKQQRKRVKYSQLVSYTLPQTASSQQLFVSRFVGTENHTDG